MHIKLHFVLKFFKSSKYWKGVSDSNIFLAEPLSDRPLASTSALILKIIEPKNTS
jgi:hypothetical protein